jgi:hypothetical protein
LHILQVKEATSPDEEEFLHNIFEVFTTEKKRGDKAKAPELSAPPPATSAPASATNLSHANMQYRYHCNAEDQRLVSELEEYLLQGKLSLTMPAHILAASLPICKSIANKLKVHHVETNEYEVVHTSDSQLPSRRVTVHDNLSDDLPPTSIQLPAFCLPLQELNILINRSIKVPAILDTSSQIVVIWHDIIQALRVPINYQQLIEMEGVNSTTNWMVGCAENLPLQVSDVVVKVHTHVVEHTSFGLLLGHPFQQATLCHFEDMPSSEVEVSMHDPADLSQRVSLSTRPHTGRAPGVKMVSICTSSHPPLSPPSPSSLARVIMQQPLPLLPPTDPTTLVLKYKHVDKKV